MWGGGGGRQEKVLKGTCSLDKIQTFGQKLTSVPL